MGADAGRSVGRWHRGVLALAPVALCAAILVVHARTYLPFFVDDSFISLRYASRFGEGEGLTWSDGERVEGYSNFLWVVILGLVRVFSEGLIVPARVLGVTSSVALLAAFAWGRARQGWRDAFGPLAGGLVVASSGSVAAWSIGGLEQPLVAALVIWGVVLTAPLLRDEPASRAVTLAPGVALGFGCLARPDTPVFVAAVAGVVLMLAPRGVAVRRAAAVAGVPAAFVAVHVAFRLFYYGEWLPNTFYAKFALTEARAVGGLAYVRDAVPHALGLVALVVAALAIAAFDRTRRGRVAAALVPVAAWLAYVVAAGGDFFPQRRHLVPAVALAALAVCEVADWAVNRRRLAARSALVVAVALGIAAFAHGQRGDPEVHAARSQVWNWRGRDLGLFLRNTFGDRSPLLAVDAAGTLPYFARMNAVDMLGLNDAYLAKHRPRGFGRGLVGHELGDGAYVLGRKPDIVVFHDMATSDVPLWKSGREMLRHESWRRLYQRVAMETASGARFALWLRKEDGPLAIVRDEDRVIVPGHLVSSRRESTSRVVVGRLGLVVTPEEPAVLRPFPLPRGRWRLTASATGRLSSSVRLADDSKPLGFGEPDLTFEHDGVLPLRLAFRTALPEVMLWEVWFVRSH